MAYTVETYYPCGELTSFKCNEMGDAYLDFFNNNEIITKHFAVSRTANSTDSQKITLTPNDPSLSSFVLEINIYYASYEYFFYINCPNLGLPNNSGDEQTNRAQTQHGNTSYPFRILETDNVIALSIWCDTNGFDYILCKNNGKHFDGSANVNPTGMTYYRYCTDASAKTYIWKNSWRVGNGDTSHIYDTPSKKCNSASTKYCLMPVVGGGKYTDIIYDNIYYVEGGVSLPAWGAIFKLNGKHFTKLFENVYVQLD